MNHKQKYSLRVTKKRDFTLGKRVKESTFLQPTTAKVETEHQIVCRNETDGNRQKSLIEREV